MTTTMLRKLLFTMLALCLIAAAVPGIVAANERPIQLIVNNESKGELDAYIQKGVMYVALRPFLNALGYTVQYNSADKEVSSNIDGKELMYVFGEDSIYFDDDAYYLPVTGTILNGQVYLPIRQLSYFTKYNVDYDKQRRTVTMVKFGYGQELAIRELVTKYYLTNSPKLLTDDTLIYYNRNFDYEADAAQYISEIPTRNFIVKIDYIHYASDHEAELQVTYTDNDQVLNTTNVTWYSIRFENGQWKIYREAVIELLHELPPDIDESAAAILEQNNKEQASVLSDIHTYYKAHNEENIELALQYTSPSFIDHWKAFMIDHSTWRQSLEAHYTYADERVKLTDERIVFLGEKEAVVHGMLEWSETVEWEMEGPYVYEALIYLDYANGHWNYGMDLHIDT
ncbi:stalk domain-containing protein [Paenibacillus sp. YIM B09110]|uniref:stalk domain-containing protein n=1 Tax=Paenibacillus sp. YIM B09110 TaxID=3126102 RepID=UPI00301E0B3A